MKRLFMAKAHEGCLLTPGLSLGFEATSLLALAMKSSTLLQKSAIFRIRTI